MEAAARSRARRRGRLLEEDLLNAAWLELAESGWAGFRMDRVAERAGAGKASLYARWPDRLSLIRAVATKMASTPDSSPVPFTGLSVDLLRLLQQASIMLGGPPGEVLRALVSATSSSTPTEVTDDVSVQQVKDIVLAAQQAGELEQADVPTRVLNMGLTLVTHHFLVNGRVPDADALQDIVESVWIPLLESATRSDPGRSPQA